MQEALFYVTAHIFQQNFLLDSTGICFFTLYHTPSTFLTSVLVRSHGSGIVEGNYSVKSGQEIDIK